MAVVSIGAADAGREEKRVVRQRGFEPPQGCPCQPLKLVRLPVPPLPRLAGGEHTEGRGTGAIGLANSRVRARASAPLWASRPEPHLPRWLVRPQVLSTDTR